MQRIEWYSEKVNGIAIDKIGTDKIYGRKFIISAADKNNFIVYDDNLKFKFGTIAAYGIHGTTELIMKREGSLFRRKNKIYELRTGNCIGEFFQSKFILQNVCYNVNRRTKWPFRSVQLFDSIFDITEIRSGNISHLSVNKIDRKWYYSITDKEIKGNLEITNESRNEFIICVFFFLQYYILKNRYD